MKPIMIKKTMAALTIILLSQPLFATSINYSNDCFASNEKTLTIDVNKFTHVWLNLHNNNEMSSSQDHLQNYIDNALDSNKGTLDVQKFAKVWDKAGNRAKEDHLTKELATMVENTNTKEDCYHATETREDTLDVEKFSDVWEKAGNRVKEDHLTKHLETMVENTNTKDDCYHATETRTEGL